jgi:hypothetical protein
VQGWHLSWNSLHSLGQGPSGFEAPFGPKYAASWSWVVSHGLAAILVLLLGPVLLLRQELKPLRRVHRKLGQIYVAATVVAGVTGLPLCLRAEGGWSGQLGMLVLCLAWLGLVPVLLRTAWNRQWEAHQAWVRCHYALTCAAIFLRLQLGIGGHYHWDPEPLAAIAPWLSMLPAALLAAFRIAPTVRAGAAAPGKGGSPVE